MSPVLSKQTGSSPSCRQALMAHSPLLPPPMMATFFVMLRFTTSFCLGTASDSGAEQPGVRLCKTLTLVHQRGPKQERQPLKSLSGLQSHCCPPPGLDLISAGFCTSVVYCGPLDALRRDPTECQGTSKSPCP